MAKNPFDFTDMFEAFDPNKMSKLFDPLNLFEKMDLPKSDMFDVTGMMEANKRNFDAMTEANKAAAESYKTMLEQQMGIFQQLTQSAQKMAQEASDTTTMQDKAKAMNAAVEEALGLMQQMAEAAKDANQSAFESIKGQVESAMKNANK